MKDINADVIVILGAGINENGTLKNPSLCRVALAAKLFHEKAAPYIIPSSKWSFLLKITPLCTIASAMKDMLIKRQVLEQNIILEDESLDTIGNIFFTKRILKKYNWKKIIVVTSEFQKERAAYLCKKILESDYQVIFQIAEDGLEPEQLTAQIKLEKELLEKTKSFFDCLKIEGDDKMIEKILENHPAYNSGSGNLELLTS